MDGVCGARCARWGIRARGVGALDRRARAGPTQVASHTGGRIDAAQGSGEVRVRRCDQPPNQRGTGRESADAVRNWKHTMLSHDDKEHGMHDEDARRAPEPVRDDPARDSRSGTCVGNATSSSRSWRPCGPNASNSRSRWSPSDTPKQLLGKERGAGPDNLTNAGKTRLVLHLAGMFVMRPRDLWGRFGLSRSTFYHNRRRLDRPGRDEWLVEPVMDAGNATATGAYGRCCANRASSYAPNGSCGS